MHNNIMIFGYMGGQVPSDRGALEHYIPIYSKSNNAHNWDRIGTTQSMFEIYPQTSNVFKYLAGQVPSDMGRGPGHLCSEVV